MLNAKSALKWPTVSIVVLLLASATMYAVFIARTSFRVGGITYFTLVDDAMVSMRYAQHLASGNGLVWNLGDKPVEGFTNPGWTILMAVLHLLPFATSKISLAVMVISALILLLNTVAVYKVSEVLCPGSTYAPVIAAATTAFYFPLVFWSLRGMEVGLLALLVDLGILAAVQLTKDGQSRTSLLLALILAAALVVRLDALPQAAILLGYVLTSTKPSWKQRALPVAAVILVLIAILWMQRAYFGDFLPNTYYQKVLGASAYERIRNGILWFNQYATADTLMLVLFSAAGAALYQSMRSREAALLASLFVVQCGYSLWVGGDYADPQVQTANRFITQGMPALIILFSVACDRFVSDLVKARAARIESNPRAQAAISFAIAMGALVVISGRPWVNWGIDNAPMLTTDIRRTAIGIAIARYTSSDATIAVHAAGQIPYYSERRTIDLLGLNDPVIAKGPLAGPFYPGHDKWNYDYSIAGLKPDVIADNWTKLGDYMRGMPDYQQLPSGMYVRKDSTLINIAGLSKVP